MVAFCIVPRLIAICCLTLAWCAAQQPENTSAQATAHSDIRLETPLPQEVVNSPLVIVGAARGNWYFEGSFPVRLVTPDGVELAYGWAQAQADWMTMAFVPFTAELRFVAPPTSDVILILEKDNPSALAENSASFLVPLTVSTEEK